MDSNPGGHHPISKYKNKILEKIWLSLDNAIGLLHGATRNPIVLQECPILLQD